MNNDQESVLTTYHQYTHTFQLAYERFVLAAEHDLQAKPEVSTALPFYNEPCMFVYPRGVELYRDHRELSIYFEQVMTHMKSSRNLRSDLGTPGLTFLGSNCALLSVEVVRVNVDGEHYDESGATYTMHRDQGLWKIAVVTVHPSEDVFGVPAV